MWSPTAVQKYGPDEYQRHLTGTGPWMLKEYKPADHYTFVKNPDYNWAPKYFKHNGPPYVDTITLRWVKETTTAVASFKAGEANMVLGFPAANTPDFRNDSKFTVYSLPYMGSPVILVCNVTNPPLDDLKVRQALEYAINSQEMVKVLTKGEAIVTRGVLYPATPGYWKDAENLYPYDPEKGKSVLKDAGWTLGSDGIMTKNGQKLSLATVIAFTNDLAPIVQAQLKQVGVDAKTEIVPGPVQLDRAVKGDFHLMYLHFAYTDPGVLDILYNSKNNKPGGWSGSRDKDDKQDSLLDQAQQTVDVNKRLELFTEVQKIIFNQALILPLYGNLRITATSNKVKGFEFGPRPNSEIYDVYIEK
jgi:peptide/nickel transport system substrate-binding protein